MSKNTLGIQCLGYQLENPLDKTGLTFKLQITVNLASIFFAHY